MDAKALSMVLNSTHITLTLTHYGELPISNDVGWYAEFYFDVDQSMSTGLKIGDIGADYLIYTRCYGDGFSYGWINRWNASRGWYDPVPSPPDFRVVFSVGEDHFSVVCPLSTIGLSQSSNFYLKVVSEAFVTDSGQTFTYLLNENVNIVVDGEPGDWVGLAPKFTDPIEYQPAEFDMTAFYTTNNQTHLFHRLDLASPPTTTPIQDIEIRRSTYIYYDIDNNQSTGYPITNIGAEYKWVLYSCYGWKNDWLYRYNQSLGYFQYDCSLLTLAWNTILEGCIPLNKLGASVGSPIKIYAEIGSSLIDQVPSGDGLAFYEPRPSLSHLSYLILNNSVRVVYPSDSSSKPLGCHPAWVSDWTASAFVTTKLEQYTEGLDIDAGFVNQTTGRPIGVPGIGIVSFGGPIVNPVVRYAESSGTPTADRAPIRFHDEGGFFHFQHWNGTGIPGACLPVSVINHDQDMFVIELYIDGSGRYILLCYGFGWKGTYAAGKYLHTAIYPNLASYNTSWIIVKWQDTNGDGFVNNPGDGDTYTIIAQG